MFKYNLPLGVYFQPFALIHSVETNIFPNHSIFLEESQLDCLTRQLGV